LVKPVQKVQNPSVNSKMVNGAALAWSEAHNSDQNIFILAAQQWSSGIALEIIYQIIEKC